MANEDGAAGIYFNDEIKENISSSSQVAFDGTFWVVPALFYQLFTVFLVSGRNFIPAIHILMTAKTERLYEACFQKIADLLPDFSPRSAMSDFERASRNAFKTVWPEAHVAGCFFHYANAVFKNIQKIGLVNLFRNNQQFNKWCRALMSVPLLRSQDIVPTVNLLLSQNFDVSAEDTALIARFKRYYRRQWLSNVSIEELSIYDETVKTNNGSESNHAAFKRKIKTNHPNLWSFHNAINDIIADAKINLDRIANGVEVGSKPKPAFVKNEQRREAARQRLEAGEIEPIEYLYIVSHGLESHLRRQLNPAMGPDDYDQDLDAEDPVEDHIENNHDQEPGDRLQCVVCLGPRERPHIFLNCFHVVCCENCATTIMQRPNPTCPTCRQRIASANRVFV